MITSVRNVVRRLIRFCPLLLAIFIASVSIACQPAPVECKLVQIGKDGRLAYVPYDKRGDVIPDFSYAGYRGGGVMLPDVRTVIKLSPADTGDDTGRIQKAIDDIGAMPLDKDGFRGALLLKAGTYRVCGAIKLNAGGVVLRGQGQRSDGTVIVATGMEKRNFIQIGGTGEPKIIESSIRKIIDEYVPVGSKILTLGNGHGFNVGDQVIVRRPGTGSWLEDIGMNRIVSTDGGNVEQWQVGKNALNFERRIVAVDGDRITLDIPLTNSFDQKYGGGTVAKYDFPGRISEVGVENLRLISECKSPTDEDHAKSAIRFDNVENGWVKNVSMFWFMHGVNFEHLAKFVTVQDCAQPDFAARIVGGRRYPFSIGRGQMILIQRCYGRHARHDYSTWGWACGPSAFVDCVSEDAYNEIGPHDHWGNGQLYDNIFVIREFDPYHEAGGAIMVQDRGNWGEGHGWAGANQVFWNCVSPIGFTCQKPPTAQNFAIGCIGPIGGAERFKDRPNGYYENHGRCVSPRSLYLAQLKDRLGQQAVKNIATDAQLEGRATEVILKTLKE